MAGRVASAGLLILSMSLAVPAAGSEVAADTPYGWNKEARIYEMVFPVVGENSYEDTWGACRGARCQRRHLGTDIMADKMTPVVAVAPGTVGWMKNKKGGACCAMAIDHDDGWRSWYVHLNNDTPGTDDGRGWGFAPGIAPGVRVEAGQLIGYVGDSGNAERTPPHIHFELERPDGRAINPYRHLRAASILSIEAELPLMIRSSSGGFVSATMPGPPSGGRLPTVGRGLLAFPAPGS